MIPNYKKWLSATAQYYGVPEKNILRKGKMSIPRKTFYYLCFRDGIDLYRLAEELGRHRTAVVSNMYYTENRDIPAEREIRTHVSNCTLDGLIDIWLDKSGPERELILTSLILRKQYLNEI